MSRGQPQPRTQFARRILERCQNSGNTEETIIIDDDTENADVVLIDNPNISHQGVKHAKKTRLNCSPRGVIYIDDEKENPRNSSTDTNTSNQFTETFCSLSLSESSDTDEFHMCVGNGNACCDHTGPSRSRYGLDLDSENSMTESITIKSNTNECDESEWSSSDCVIMEDHSGIIREQWEKAALRKKGGGQFASSDQATMPHSTFYTEDPSHAPTLDDADVANCFERMPSNYFEEMFAQCGTRFTNNAEQRPSANVLCTDGNEDFYLNTAVNVSVTQSYSSSHIPCKGPGKRRDEDESNLEEQPQTAHSMNDGLSFLNKDAREPVKTSLFTCESHGKSGFFDKEEPSTTTSHAFGKLDGKQVSNDNDLSPDRVEHKLDEREASDFKESLKIDFEESSSICSQLHEVAPIKAPFCGHMDSKMKSKVDALFATTDVGLTAYKPDDMPHGYESLIGERERYKETDEYRRVAEEEWASRHRQLQIQAEEAQRLRKRRKAENMRLLDMEKRQKQRLEEIRDLQKKDEETTKLKERIRTEVRKELEALEMKCRDMASVLRALGVHVKGGFIPTVHEINAAYKQALLRFHPDRASRTDIRQQVEAEEKFKLISRLKEKLLF
ncbi:uncharacterized protein LOC110038763 [Phalaenopsis equestris]|uniref:uncharacterized protein LOC110038763 n=1 Tax=Phalaenopsis equestris TaxID=78828 RepID=UPI0009E43E16|nr:uncharacterized protein LOC110038763 [Phalaenopsis equestris]